jgi:hypothetical protein
MALTLFAHIRSGKRVWLALTGVLCAGAVLLEIDTGIPLVICTAIYCVGTVFIDRSEGEPGHRGNLVAAGLAFLVTLVAGLIVVSRGTLITRPTEFVAGWMSGITGYAGSGAGNMYFLSRIDATQITIFIALVVICFIPIARVLARVLHGNARRVHIFAATCGIYGLTRLIVYITRTLDNNLFHASLPAIGIATVIVGYWYSATFSSDDQAEGSSLNRIEFNLLRTGFPAAAVAVATLVLWTSDSFREYPGLLQTRGGEESDSGLAILPDTFKAQGIPAESAGRLVNIDLAVQELRDLGADDAKIVVLDENATLYNIASNNPPWRADFSVYFNVFFVQDREKILSELLSYSPEYIFIAAESPGSWYDDTWSYYRDGLNDTYERIERAGTFDILKRRSVS